MNHGTGVAKDLANGYYMRCNGNTLTEAQRESYIDLGIRLGIFFLCLAGLKKINLSVFFNFIELFTKKTLRRYGLLTCPIIQRSVV